MELEVRVDGRPLFDWEMCSTRDRLLKRQFNLGERIYPGTS